MQTLGAFVRSAETTSLVAVANKSTPHTVITIGMTSGLAKRTGMVDMAIDVLITRNNHHDHS